MSYLFHVEVNVIVFFAVLMNVFNHPGQRELSALKIQPDFLLVFQMFHLWSKGVLSSQWPGGNPRGFSPLLVYWVLLLVDVNLATHSETGPPKGQKTPRHEQSNVVSAVQGSKEVRFQAHPNPTTLLAELAWIIYATLRSIYKEVNNSLFGLLDYGWSQTTSGSKEKPYTMFHWHRCHEQHSKEFSIVKKELAIGLAYKISLS